MPKSRADSEERKDQIVRAAMESLREAGYAGTTIREIARRGGFNSALISYYFGSLHGLLLAALDRSSEIRMQRYRSAVAEAKGLEDLLDVARTIYREDVEGGHITIFTEMVGASLAHPELAPALISRSEPWLRFVEDVIRQAATDDPALQLLPVSEVAHAILCFYLGVNLMTHLEEDDTRTESLFAAVKGLLPIMKPFLDLSPGKESQSANQEEAGAAPA